MGYSSYILIDHHKNYKTQFIFFYDEMRKYLMRKTSKDTISEDTGKTLRIPGWLEKMTYY